MQTLKAGESRYWAAITIVGRGEYLGINLDPKKAARAVDKVKSKYICTLTAEYVWAWSPGQGGGL